MNNTNNINNNIRDVIEQAKMFNPNVNDKQEDSPNDVKVEVDTKHNYIICNDMDSARCEEILNSFREHPVDMEREFFRCSLPTHGESTFYNREVEIGWEDPIKDLHSEWK